MRKIFLALPLVLVLGCASGSAELNGSGAGQQVSGVLRQLPEEDVGDFIARSEAEEKHFHLTASVGKQLTVIGEGFSRYTLLSRTSNEAGGTTVAVGFESRRTFEPAEVMEMNCLVETGTVTIVYGVNQELRRRSAETTGKREIPGLCIY